MPALAPYIPNRDADFLTWSQNFSTVLTANPALYGLTASDATAVDALVDTFTTAYGDATAPSTRTPVTVQAKNIARINAEAGIRPYAQAIANNAGVSSDDKIAIGVNPRTSVPSPIGQPTTFPDLSVNPTGPLQVTARYRDSEATPTSKAKPYGSTQVQIFGMTSATVVTDPTTLPLLATVTKSPTLMTFGSSDANKTCYFAARFITRRGLVGPWSAITAATIPAAM